MLSYFSDDLQHDGSLTGVDGESEHNTDEDVIEDIAQLLTDIIDDVVRESSSENDCTRKPLKRRATDVLASSSEPKRKQPFSTVTQRTVFNPVAEHHLWCPYVSDIVCDGPNNGKPWLRLLQQLVPDQNAALTRVQTSPIPDGIEFIRKLFRTWTSTA